MKPQWFNDSIPLDPLIAPMVLFFQNNGIITTQSCQGGNGNHLYGKPTVSFRASTLKEIDFVAGLLKKHKLDTSMEIGLMTGFFSDHSRSIGSRYGQVHWLWENTDDGMFYTKEVYPRVCKLVNMKEISSITMDHDEWERKGRPTLR